MPDCYENNIFSLGSVQRNHSDARTIPSIPPIPVSIHARAVRGSSRHAVPSIDKSDCAASHTTQNVASAASLRNHFTGCKTRHQQKMDSEVMNRANL